MHGNSDCAYLWVGGADPLRRGAGDDGVGARGVDHLGAALLHVRLGGLALLVALAVALWRRKRILMRPISRKRRDKKRGHFSSSRGVGVDVRRLCGNLLGRPKSIPMTLDGKLDRSAG